MKTLIYFILSIVTMAKLPASTLQVPSQYATIQSAVNASSNGDTVLVAPGTYMENVTLYGKRIVLASHFILEGDRSYIAATVINGSQPVHADTASVIRIVHGEDSTTVITGFTITGGSGTKWEDPLNPGYIWRGGGGIIILNASPVIRYNIIRSNSVNNTTGVSGAQGGGILCYGGYPEIVNNWIVRNSANYGGGIVIDYSGALVKNNIIYRNTGGTEWYGGSAIWCIGEPTLPRSKIIENNTILSNVAATGTGGILIWNATTTIRNNILWGNSITQIKKVGGTVNASYNDIQGGYTGTGNINANPLFADSQLFLQTISPCIDAGDVDSVYNDPENISQPGFAEWPSLGLVRNDIGAYGGPCRHLLPFAEEPWISLLTASLNFGTVSIDDSVVRKIALSSKGTLAVQIDSVCVKHQFPGITCLTGLALSIPPYGSDTLRMQWSPVSEMPLTDTLLIYHNDTTTANPLCVPLSGSVTSVDIDPNPALPFRFSLEQNYPNPFNPSTMIQYALPIASHVELVIYNILGQPVKTLVRQYETAGYKTALWDGTDNKGKIVSSGIYLYRITIDGISYTKKMVLSR